MIERMISSFSCRHAVLNITFIVVFTLAYVDVSAQEHTIDIHGTTDEGQRIYQYYCYQCHGYAGDARTLASTYLSPSPRAFTTTSRDALPLESMIDAVLRGRPGTAMVGFSSVLNAAQAEAVASYILYAFMSEKPNTDKYHSARNGWPDHERYAPAFPFVDGTVPLSVPWESLTPMQTAGRRLYESACVTCHVQPSATSDDSDVWALRAVSYPRRHFSHRQDEPDWVTTASPYRIHDKAPDVPNLTDQQFNGKRLFEANCAFCHAVDGTGRNWIGSFLDTRPRNLTDPVFHDEIGEAGLRERIADGVSNTSMPAWKQVLSNAEIDAIVAYVRTVLAGKP